jgi:hypothetical protein
LINKIKKEMVRKSQSCALMASSFCYTKHLLWFVDLQNNLEFYNLPCLSFVQGLKCKWISAQEPRLMMRYKSLTKTELGLGLVRLKLNWID